MSVASIYGNNLTSLLCAIALARFDWKVTLDANGRSFAPPILVVNKPTVEVLSNLAGISLESFGYAVNKKQVCWGARRIVQTAKETSYVFQSDVLINCLSNVVAGFNGNIQYGTVDDSRKGWHIDCSLKGPKNTQIRYQQRTAFVALVTLADDRYAKCLTIEDSPAGWLFLAPCGNNTAVLQVFTLPSSGKSVQELVQDSNLISKAIAARTIRNVKTFCPVPYLNTNIVDRGQLQCGSAAFKCDPICGDGLGFSTRAAILAAAALNTDHFVERALEWYRYRLSLSMLHHIRNCLALYSQSLLANAWRTELDAMVDMAEWIANNLCAPPETFVLDQFTLSRLNKPHIQGLPR